ncbi:hypothetical protein SteCoe_29563 [Stentor coeruleus]|uniref:Uncharacterized protein n=1 Tax=Stentor coeruleus TaxID=5963 RepID=A0A1R2B5N8_9CILI|nr:hypothetical protein SteCoe_29563 [Stentor coeruleus]
MASTMHPLKQSQKSPSKEVTNSLITQKQASSELNKEINDSKFQIRENQVQKEWLNQLNSKIHVSPKPNDNFFVDLKSKYEICKGTNLGKLMSDLIKAYEKFNSQSSSYDILNTEKEQLLQDYQKITNSLSQEANLRKKAMILQESLESKGKLINDLENKLKVLRHEYQDIKNTLDNNDIKNYIESRDKIVCETYKCIEEQTFLMTEIDKIDLDIKLEKNVNKITPETTNRLLKSRKKDMENSIAEIMRVIRDKEKIVTKLKMDAKKNAAIFKAKNNETDLAKSCRSCTNLQSPNNASRKSLKFSPNNTMKTHENLVSAESQSPDRDKAVKLFTKGFNHENSEKIIKTLNRFGTENQSFATKLVKLNRDGFKLS